MSRAAFQIVLMLVVIAEIALATILYHRVSFWIVVPLMLAISHLMHGAAIGFHEASHGLLRRSRRLNEFDGVLLGLFSLMSFSLYRASHQTHHAHLATERDEELWPFVCTDAPLWKRRLAAFLELTLGLFFTPCLFLRTFFRPASPIRSLRVRRRIWAELILIILFWTTILVSVAHWQLWRYFLCMYLIPAMIAANLQSWRKYIEHVGLTSGTVKGSTRSIVANGWAGRLVSFTLLHEPYHGVHHLRVGLPHPELPRFVPELTPTTSEEKHPFKSYRHAWIDLIQNLRDPRVGAQWNARQPGKRTDAF